MIKKIIFNILCFLLFDFRIFAFDIIAHRGASAYSPENTHSSIELAWELGAKGCEIDVQLTKDNKIVVVHDKNLKRVSGQFIEIKNTKYDFLKDIDVSYKFSNSFIGERIPLFEDVIKKLPKDKLLFVELKDESIDIVREVVKVLKEYPLIQNRIFIISFEHRFVDSVKKQVPQVNTLYLISHRGDKSNEHNVKSIQKLSDIIQSLKTNKIDGLSIEFSQFLTPRVLNFLSDQKILLSLWAYEEDDVLENFDYITKFRFDYITTNYPNIFYK